MKKLSMLAIALIAWAAVSAQSGKWGFDPSHSKVRFAVAHMVISDVEGQFNKYEGTVLSDKDDFSDAKVEFTIEVNSIDTDNEKRDEHLKSADFFDAAKYPKITFKSKSITKLGANLYKLTGILTMHGVTKDVTLEMKYGGTVKDPYENTKAGFKITGTINRTLWGLEYNSVIEAGGLMIGEEVDITCNIELIRL